MKISVEQAARDLYSALDCPAGWVNILPCHETGGDVLRVWLSPGNRPLPPGIPREFEGYPVRIERRAEGALQRCSL